MTATMEFVRIEDIRTAGFNPPMRTSRENLEDLIESIKLHGFLPYPLLIGNDGFLGDGHRRRAAAQVCGLTELPVIRVASRTAALIWIDMNGPGKHPLKMPEMLAAVAAGFDVEMLPPHQRRPMQHLLGFVGVEGMRRLARHGASIDVWTTARELADFCEDTNDDFMRQCIWWAAITPDATMRFRRFKVLDGDPEMLHDIITTGKRLVMEIRSE